MAGDAGDERVEQTTQDALFHGGELRVGEEEEEGLEEGDRVRPARLELGQEREEGLQQPACQRLPTCQALLGHGGLAARGELGGQGAGGGALARPRLRRLPRPRLPRRCRLPPGAGLAGFLLAERPRSVALHPALLQRRGVRWRRRGLERRRRPLVVLARAPTRGGLVLEREGDGELEHCVVVVRVHDGLRGGHQRFQLVPTAFRVVIVFVSLSNHFNFD